MECPIGKYEGTFGYFCLTEDSIIVHKKMLFKTVETTILYPDVANVGFEKAAGVSGGFLCVRQRNKANVPLATTSSAAVDETSLTFIAQKNTEMFLVFQYLNEWAQKNCIDSAPLLENDIPETAQAFATRPVSVTVTAELEHPTLASPINVDAYYERFYPNKMAAIKALVSDYNLDIGQAKRMIEDVFKQNQPPQSVQTPAEAMTDFKKIMHPKKAAFYDRQAELEKSNVVYCPKCLSTSISANQKGFGFARGALGAAVGLDVGMLAGGIGSKKVVCTCLKCGHKWMPEKK